MDRVDPVDETAKLRALILCECRQNGVEVLPLDFACVVFKAANEVEGTVELARVTALQVQHRLWFGLGLGLDTLLRQLGKRGRLVAFDLFLEVFGRAGGFLTR